MSQYVSKIKELVYMKPSQLLDHPKQWKLHGDYQRQVLDGILTEVGIVSPILATEINGKLYKVDGHLRSTMSPDQDWPVLICDLTEAEAEKILLTHDEIAGMAEKIAAKGRELTEAVRNNIDNRNVLLTYFVDNVVKPDLQAIQAAIKQEQSAAQKAVAAPRSASAYAVFVECTSEGDRADLLCYLDSCGLKYRLL